MFRKIALSLILVVFVLAAAPAFGQDNATASLRLLNLDTSSTVLAARLEDGRGIATNLASGSASDYVSLTANQSTFLTLTFVPRGGNSFNREWAVPLLAPGHYTAAIVGRSTDITLQLTFISEDALCADKLAAGSCIVLINNVAGMPPVTLSAGSTRMIENAAYRHAVVNGVPARSYLGISAVNASNPDATLFQLQRGFFAPNVISFYTLNGTYSAGTLSNFGVGTLQRVPVDTMTFLRGLTADLNLTGGSTLIAAENIVAVLESVGFDQLLANPNLPLTVFAPTDEAVVAVADLYQCALANPAALRTLVLSHVVAGSYTPSELINAGQIPAMSGMNHTFRAASGGFLIDNTFVSGSLGYPTTNGNVYLIDKVLVPPTFVDQYCSAG